ncbi:hypothetical protein FSARC_4631 [Fusarium sarcochroum]|uniref:Xylanolytic transcriptional activator regulatory domain-containing protein n=1 Tax=Fusarium sarcochroum TaxID=1208366 RepID=A0A8H4XBA0_9HYPO|nr:hypothetical protein FSARC_4631 [Fusarium sarcochroum]
MLGSVPPKHSLQERVASLEGKAIRQTPLAPAPQSRSPELVSSYGPPEPQGHQPDGQVKTPLINPLAFHTYDFVPGPKGRLGTPLPTHNLHFLGVEGKVYDLKWDGIRRPSSQDLPDLSTLPAKDFSLYLINSVKFHCGWMYHLFDEEIFMERFHLFHERPAEYARAQPLWFVHYLLVLAFGKAFVVQSTKSRRPPGGDLFKQAMKLMPDFTFFECDIIEEMQVLSCAAIYLHCVDYIEEAYRLTKVCNALRHSLESGMHTEMQSSALDEAYVQRCRTQFWTVYILERQMVSQLGLPVGIPDESISTHFPTLPGQPEKLEALKIHVDFCRVLAKIDQTVYGLEGKLDSRYLGATQSVLKSIATVTQRLNNSFEVHPNEGMAGISRISAHLHLLQHQQILRILSSLSDQGLLETFLRFDQDATFTATIAILMAAAIDSSLLPDPTPWTQRAFAIFDEMSSRGNLVAGMVASELKQLEGLLKGFLVNNELRPPVAAQDPSTPHEGTAGDIDASAAAIAGYPEPFNLETTDDFGLGLNYELSADQLMNIANSLDIDSLTWPWPEDSMVEDVEGA